MTFEERFAHLEDRVGKIEERIKPPEVAKPTLRPPLRSVAVPGKMSAPHFVPFRAASLAKAKK